MNAACDLLQILCENFLDSQLWREGEAELSRQAAFCLMQDSASRYLSLTTVTLQLLDRARSQSLMAEGVICGGMIPKVGSCLYALDAGCRRALILDGREPGSLRRYLYEDAPLGTVVTA